MKKGMILRILKRSQNVQIVVIPNRYFEIPKFHIERSAQNSGKASYKVVEQPLEEDLERIIKQRQNKKN